MPTPNIMPAISSPTITELAEKYLNHYGQAKNDRSLKNDEKLLKNIILPAFGSAEVELVSHHTIETLHNQLSAKPYQANRILALLSQIFSLGISWGWRQDNPVKGVEKYQIKKQNQWLNSDKLERFWAALDQYPNHLMTYFFKLLTLTRVRQNELMQATWDQFDMAKGIWIRPSHLTKQQKTAHLKLSNKALEILDQIKKLSDQISPYVFSGNAYHQPIKGEEIKAFWKIIMKTAKLENFHICNLRYTQTS